MANFVELGLNRFKDGMVERKDGLLDIRDNIGDFIKGTYYQHDLRGFSDKLLDSEVRTNQDVVVSGVGILLVGLLVGGLGMTTEKFLEKSKTARVVGGGMQLASLIPISAGLAVGAYGFRDLRLAVREQQWREGK